ncbi:TM2 domain-containing protein [Roseomonas sp. NAR14]|uniref:TM2 domain-containing protein n=1 Tax=Roseomonas acroporae TaxID=2937791 RepID=A0A9X1YC92_9PROT|nr:TM2 domain-containing protein [Roseomonas acroporae]MCK8787473.1 TM2 domain-containing protein [Roseomonas acroporae]
MTQMPAQAGSQDVQRMMLYDATKKSVGVAFALWFFLCFLGGHRFYVGRTGTAVLMALLSLTVVGLAVTAVWSLIDAFLIPGWIRDYNLRLIGTLT